MNFETYKETVERLDIGKRLPDAIYLHESLLCDAPDHLVDFIRDSVTEYASDVDWNVIKLFRRDFKFSLLSYPRFFAESYPELARSTTIDLIRKQSRTTDYTASDNPPILHRRETLIGKQHSSYAQCAAITKEGDAIGLYQNSKQIGFKKSWERHISKKGFTLVEGHLIAKANVVQPVAQTLVDIDIARHRTAIHRDQLSTPMQYLARHGYLSGEYSVFDYGCGKGHDVAELEAHGVDAIGWDPEFCPETRKRPSDIVNLGFVINVIEDRVERATVLREAYGLAKKVVSVSVMIAGETTIQKYAAYKDGVITSRNTFQKYYSQSEIRSFLETVLKQSAIAVAPGVFFVFKDEREEQRFLSSRQRVHREWRQLTVRDRSATPVDHQSLIEANEQLFRDFWMACLDLGRPPANDEFDRSRDLRRIIGSQKKAFNACADYFGETEYTAARDGRIEDLLVFIALSFFGRRPAYRKIPVSLQRDVKAFFDKPSVVHAVAREALFSVADSELIASACLEARKRLNCGHLEVDHSYVVRASLLPRLPGILRIYIGCATQLYGDMDAVDLIKIHMKSAKVSLMIYDDFAKPLPLLKERVKIRLRDQEIDWFYYGEEYAPQPLYLKSLYLDEDDPTLPAQDRFDRYIANLKGIDLSEFGPTLPDLNELLRQNSCSFETIEREFYQTLNRI